MYVGLHVVGNVIVDHAGDVLHVETARRHICGHENFHIASAEGLENLEADILLLVPVQSTGTVPMPPEHPIEVNHLSPGVTKNEDGTFRVRAQSLLQDLELVTEVHLDIDLLDIVHCGQALGSGEYGGIFHITAQEFLDLGWKRCREEKSLTLIGYLLDNRTDVINKAHVEHAIGLVQHHHFTPDKG